MKKYLLIFAALCISSISMAQQTGEVVYKTLGLKFTIPNGWVGQEVEGGFLIGHQTTPGFVLLSTHEAKTLDALKQEARQGIADGNGTMLQMAGDFEQVTANGVGAEFSGTLEWQQARAYIIGLINPQGTGVTILTATTADQYNESYRNLGHEVAKSVQFFKAELPPIVDEWKQTLQNCRLTYMDSYYSSGPSYGDYQTGGGYQTKTTIDLCARGYFNHSHASSVSVDTGGAFGNSHGSGQGAGTWEVVANAAGEPVLKLNFYSGEVREYVLSYRDEKTYLNGDRYFRTYDGEFAPNCQ